MHTGKLALAVLLLGYGVGAQETSKFIGSWKGVRNGQTYLVLTIAAGEPLKITLATSHIHVGDSGEIDEIDGPPDQQETVTQAKLQDGKLRFQTRQEGGDLIDYELTLDLESTASLRLLDAPDFVKPFRLTRP